MGSTTQETADPSAGQTPPEARLIIASGEGSPDLYYRTGFLTPDPYVFFEHSGESSILVSDLEVDRAKKQARVDHVLPTRAWEKTLSSQGKPASTTNIVSAFLGERNISAVLVPFDFPAGYAEGLRQNGIRVVPGSGPFFPERALKTKEEARWIREAQEGVEEALWVVVKLLREASVR
ncbi:MAG: hypothetical protein ACYC9S_08705, partial [Leptospirales bacterium]